MNTLYHSTFTPSQSDSETLEDLFVVREKLAQRIMDGIRESATSDNKHQRLLIGPRGIGKTHLVALIYHRVRQDTELDGQLRIAWLPEDPYIAGYQNLLLLILQTLQQVYRSEDLGNRLEEILDLEDPDRAELMLEQLLLHYLDNKTLLLIAENLDELLTNLKESGQRKLRAFLQNHPISTILATTTSLSDAVAERKNTFYGFFKVHTLDPFTVADAVQLLARMAKRACNSELANAIGSPMGQARIRAVHYLAGGNPRIYVIFYDFLTRESLDDLVEPFMKLIDELTPYYQARMDRLAPLQRSIIDILRRLRGAVTVKEIARQAMNTPQTISAQLGKLKELGYVTQAAALGRSNYYELREPLMRLCLEVKEQHGRTVELFVQFLRVWYSETELKQLAYKYAISLIEKTKHLREAIEQTQAELQVYFEKPSIFEGEPKTVTEWEQKGDDLWRINRPDEALLAYSKALALNPHYIDGWFQLWAPLEVQGRYQLFHNIVKRMTAFLPEEAWLWYCFGIANTNLGRFKDALAAYDQALAIDPELDKKGLPVSLCRTMTLSKLGHHASALKTLETILPYDSKDLQFQYNLAQADVLMWLDRWEESHGKLGSVLSCFESDTWSGIDLEIIGKLIAGTQNPDIWQRFISVWLDLFGQHEWLMQLGQGLVWHIDWLAFPWISDSVARAWYETWQELAGNIEEMALPLRLLKTAVEYKATRDHQILLKLPQEERRLLEPRLINLLKEEPDEIDLEMDNLLHTVEQQLAPQTKSSLGLTHKGLA